MADRYLLESGAPDGYLLEDGSGVLLLEVPLPFVQASTIPSGFFRRKNVTHRRSARLAEYPTAQAPAANTSRANVAEQFKTRQIRSRRLQPVWWSASMATAPAAPVQQPVSAWLSRPVARRESTSRVLVKPAEIEFQVIAPPAVTMLPERPKARVIQYKRRLIAQSPQVLYPPPTGPPVAPFPAWAARAIKAVSQDRRLQRLFDQPVYPATPPAAFSIAALIKPTTLRVVRRARLVKLPDLQSYPATPVTTSPDRSQATPFVTRQIRSRRMQPAPLLVLASVAPPVISQAPVSALIRAKQFKRKARPGLFLGGSAATDGFTAGAAPAQPASAWRAPKHHRREFARHLQRVRIAPVYPATPAAPPQPYGAWKGTKPTFVEFDRSLKRSAPQPTYPATAPIVTTYLDAVRATRRKETRRKLRKLAIAPVFTPTPPPPAQPLSAWKAPKQHRADFVRRLKRAGPQLLHPATPAPTFVPGRVIVKPHGRGDIKANGRGNVSISGRSSVKANL